MFSVMSSTVTCHHDVIGLECGMPDAYVAGLVAVYLADGLYVVAGGGAADVGGAAADVGGAVADVAGGGVAVLVVTLLYDQQNQ